MWPSIDAGHGMPCPYDSTTAAHSARPFLGGGSPWSHGSRLSRENKEVRLWTRSANKTPVAAGCPFEQAAAIQRC